MIKNYYNFLRLLLLFVALSQVDTLFAQSLKVSGKILDSSSPEGVPGVLVSVKGKQQTTVSDMNGNYTITVTERNAVLEFKSVGYETKEVAVNGQATINVTLTADLKSLEEVVVMGYGTQKKVNLIGAVSTIKVDEALTTRSVSNVSSALSGLVPGLAVIQSTGMAGNNDASLVIRGVGTVNGNSGPLIVVDGMPGVDINRVNINDVETVTVLKDASSAAVYGSRASNGVILITTRSGKGSKKASIDFNGNTSVETPTSGFSFLADYPRALTVQQNNQLNGALENNLLYKNGTIDEWMAKGMIDPLRYPNTDWWDLIIRDGVISNYNVSATGGTEKSNFFASVGVKDEKGLQINNDYKQYNARFNFDYAIRKNINTGVRFNGNWSNYLRSLGEGFTGDGTAGLDMRYAIAGITPYDPATGYYGGVMAYGENLLAYNPYQEYQNKLTRSERKEALTMMYVDWAPIKGLTARAEYGLTYANQFSYRADIPNVSYNFQRGAPGTRIYVDENAPITNGTNDDFRSLFTGRLNYNTTIAKNHDISGVLVYTEEFWRSRSLTGERNDRIHPTLTEIDAALPTTQSTTGSSNTEGIRSYVARFNYSAYSKYLFEVSARYDGSSKFADGYQWGLFPAVGLGWRFTEEKFIKPFVGKFLSSGKLRANYGALGDNQGIGKYEQQTTLASQPYILGTNIVKGFINNKLVNLALSWESTIAANFGLELGFFNDKLTAELEYYDRLNSGMIRGSQLSTHLTGAYTAPRTNIGQMRNRGVEGTFTWNDKIKSVRYRISANASYNANRLEEWQDLLTPGTAINGNNSFINMPYGYLYTYEDTGIAQNWQDVYSGTPQGAQPGDVLRKDLNGDGQITGLDRKAYGNSQENRPTTYFGLNGFVSWKGVDLGILLQGSSGRKDFLINNFTGSNIPPDRAAITQSLIDRAWSVENRSGDWPRLGGNNNQTNTTFWLQDMSFLRLKNIQLGYNLPKKLLSKIGGSNLRIAASAENLLTLTSYEGLDPEKAASSSNLYPLNRSYSLALQLGF